tara:strand:- start:337 stop:2331 length:1995 start_codon:yes stop_codon:yes gene_type:complete
LTGEELNRLFLEKFSASPPVAAFSLRKLGNVSPYAARIRRSYDNTEAQVMFDASDRVSESSVVRNTAHNLMPVSEQFSLADWVKYNATASASTITDPFGGTNAYKFAEASTASNSKLMLDAMAVELPSGTTCTWSVHAKKAELDILQLIVADGATFVGGDNHANFNLSTGQVTATGGGASASIEALSNDWYRCSMTVTTNSTGTTSPRIGIQNSPTAARDGAYTGNGTDGIYIFGAQVEQASSPSEYISTPVVSNDGLTFVESDLDSFVGGENLRKYSNEFNAASWGITNFNAAVNNNLANPINGTVDSIKLVAYDTGGAAKHEFYTRYPATSGVQYAHSIYIKPFGTVTHVIGSDSGSSSRAAAFDLVNGTVVSNGLSNQGASIEAVGSDGWMRVTFVFTATATVSDRYIYWAVGDSASLVNGNARTDNYDADGTGQGVYAWGAQVNLGTTAKAHSKTEATIRDGNAAISVLYNQTGGQDAIQSTTGHQPLLYNAGLLVKSGTSPSIDFEGTHTIHIDTLAGQSRLDIYAIQDTSDATYIYPSASNSGSQYGIYANDGASSSAGSYLGSASFGTPNVYKNGSAFNPSTLNDVHDGLTGQANLVTMEGASTSLWTTFTVGHYFNNSAPSFNFTGKISELIVFTSNESSNRNTIEQDINDFHNIY